jgi:GcrA cell cycle regulator
MSWDENKVEKLKELWGKGKTASQIAEIIGGISRNAVIGKAHRLNLSAKIKSSRSYSEDLSNKFPKTENFEKSNDKRKKISRSRFKSLLIEKDFEPENPKQLEELNDNLCKWPIGHPNENSFYFCGRTSLKDFSYCKLHLLYAFQPKVKKEDLLDKNNEEIPKYIKKKIKSA